MELTETFATLPAASVSGLYFHHPEARYFSVGRIGARPGRGLRGAKRNRPRRGRTLAHAEPCVHSDRRQRGYPVALERAPAGRSLLFRMRTTLKRGIGRSAGTNGNGHAVLPPAILSPVRRYTQPPRRRRRWVLVGKFFVGFLALVVLLALGSAGGAYLYYHQSVAAVAAHSKDVKVAQKALHIAERERAGDRARDRLRQAKGDTDRGRSDTLMLLRADPTTKSISMLSFPARPDHADLVRRASHLPSGSTRHMRSAAREGALDTVKKLTGLPINYLITVNFKGFIEIVDRVDGVWIDVDRRYFNRNVGTAGTNYSNIDLRPGYQRLKGRDALVVRPLPAHGLRPLPARAPAAVREGAEAADLEQLLDLQDLRSSWARSRTTSRSARREGARSRELKRYALFAYGLPSGHFFQSKIERPPGDQRVVRPTENVAQAVRDFETPDVEAPRNATAVAFGRKAAGVKTLPPSRISISVLNGNGVAGAASNGRVRARPARLPARRSAERGRPQRAELRLLPLEGLLRPQAAGVAGRCAEGRRSLRRCRVGTAAGVVALQGAERDADRRRRIDVPRDTGSCAGRQDAEETACVGALGSRRDQGLAEERAQEGGLPP